MVSGRAHRRNQIPVGQNWRDRNGAQGLHRLLRPCRGNPRPFGRRRAGRGTSLYRCGHARRGRADDGGHDLLPRHSRTDRIDASGVAREGRGSARCSKLGLIAPNFTAAHAIWIDDDDMARLADAGASVAHNPGSNMKLGSGLAAARKMRDRGTTLGIGTDGCVSSDNQNVFEAMRMAAFVSRVQGPDPHQWLTAEEAFEAATKGGARALGMENLIGQLAPGFKADLVFLDLTSINYVPLNEPLYHVVFVEDGTGVDRVMVGGRMFVEGGKVLGVDMVKLRDEANAATKHLAQVNAAARDFVRAFEPVVLDYCVGLAREPYHVHRWCGH